MTRLVILILSASMLMPIAVSFAAELPTTGVKETSKQVETAKISTASANIPSAKAFRLGYADMSKIAEKSDAAKIAKAHFEAKADKFKAQLETKQKLLEKQKAALEAKLPTYTPEQRNAKIKEYEKKVEELRKMLVKADQELKPLQEELVKNIYGRIEKVAREYGTAKGYSAIVEKRELLYLGGNVEAEDLTDALIAELNSKPTQ